FGPNESPEIRSVRYRLEGWLMPANRRCVKEKNRLHTPAACGFAGGAGGVMSKHADWMRALEQLREALDQTSVEVARHEQTLNSPLLTSDLTTERHTSWLRALERF